jgi:hypothetical protein
VEYADVVSTVALALSVVAIGVQLWQWRRGGHQIALETRQGFYGLSNGGVSDGFLTIVTVFNRGRGAVDIVSWGFETPAGKQFVQISPMPGSTPLPSRLDAGQQATLMMQTEGIEEECARRNIAFTELRAFVRLGDGSTVKGLKGIGLMPNERQTR